MAERVTNGPVSAIDPLGLCRNDPSQPCVEPREPIVTTGTGGCSMNNIPTSCAVVFSFASAGGGGQFGILCATCSPFGFGTQWTADPDGRIRRYSCRYGDCGLYVVGFLAGDAPAFNCMPGTPGCSNGRSGRAAKAVGKPKPLSTWDKVGLVVACIAGMDPDYAKPRGEVPQLSDSTDSTNTTEGQGPPYGLNKRGRSVPYGGSPEVPEGAAGAAAYGAGVGQCINNVFTAWPKH
jgi:hypothetical protein